MPKVQPKGEARAAGRQARKDPSGPCPGYARAAMNMLSAPERRLPLSRVLEAAETSYIDNDWARSKPRLSKGTQPPPPPPPQAKACDYENCHGAKDKTRCWEGATEGWGSHEPITPLWPQACSLHRLTGNFAELDKHNCRTRPT